MIATGGLSIPKMGATGFAYDIARRFGLPLIEPRPGLVPLKFADETLEPVQRLCRGFGRGDRFMRPRQLSREYPVHPSRPVRSGDPADFVVLARRRYARDRPCAGPGCRKLPADRKRTRPKAELKTVSGRDSSDAPGACPCRDGATRDRESSRSRSRRDLAQRLKRWQMKPTDSEGWDKAEVTVGGIDTAGLSSRTMEARAVPVFS